MKKLLSCLFIILFFVTSGASAGLRVGYLAPSNPAFKPFSDEFLNGLYLGLSDNETVVTQNEDNNSKRAFENLLFNSVDVVIGPFDANSVNSMKSEICSSSTVTILPFAAATYTCPYLFIYNYDPPRAAVELGKILSNMQSEKTILLYEYDSLDITKKDAFLNAFSGTQPEVVGFKKQPLYENLIKSVFGVRRTRKVTGLTEEPVFSHSKQVDNIVMFAPQSDLISIINLIDYYSINPKHIFSSDIVINRNLFSLSDAILKKLYFITPYYECSSDPVNVAFVKRYRDSYQSDPGFMAALGFDIGRILKGADRVSLVERIRQTEDFDGLVGRLLFFDDTGRAFINYKFIGYKEIKRCRDQILNR